MARVSTGGLQCQHSLSSHDSRFSDIHQFEKPNDKRALECMNSAARFVLEEIQDVILAFGESDEFRCVVSAQ